MVTYKSDYVMYGQPLRHIAKPIYRQFCKISISIKYCIDQNLAYLAPLLNIVEKRGNLMGGKWLISVLSPTFYIWQLWCWSTFDHNFVKHFTLGKHRYVNVQNRIFCKSREEHFHIKIATFPNTEMSKMEYYANAVKSTFMWKFHHFQTRKCSK